jgi:hypothetical protein
MYERNQQQLRNQPALHKPILYTELILLTQGFSLGYDRNSDMALTLNFYRLKLHLKLKPKYQQKRSIFVLVNFYRNRFFVSVAHECLFFFGG